ncbi:MAG TPA: DinB family protein [Bryobacteraceae bacterium]|nr:DinB family protein [Bryobacteraceae bacterium]
MRFVLLLATVTGIAYAQAMTADGDALFSKGDWAGAAREFQGVVEKNPQDGRAFFRLGAALHRLGKYQEAATAFESAVHLEFQAPYASAAVARSYAALGDNSKATEWLTRSARGGFTQLSFLDEPAFASLKKDPGFAAAKERIRINGKPCSTEPEYKQFDFWLGEWDVEVSGQKIARSRIEKISDGCIIQENWMPFNGLSGKSWNFYNPASKKWEQVWIGPDGGVLKVQGEATAGKMSFQGIDDLPDGRTKPARLTLTLLPDHTVRQVSERSDDGGKTWTAGFEGIYRPLAVEKEQAISEADRRELLEHLKTSRRIFHEALRGVSPDQAKFKAAPDRWSILECAEHIVQAEQLLFADALAGLDQPPTGARSKVNKEALLDVWGTAKVKVKSSGDYDPIGRWPDLATIEKVFDARRERSIDFIAETERDLHGRICCGDLDIWQQILAMSAHTLRHVQQIEAVKTDPSYPRQ